jgi:hypothetical protein
MRVALSAHGQRELIVNIKRERFLCLLARHSLDLRFLIFDWTGMDLLFFQSQIKNQKFLEWLADPGCSLLKQGSNSYGL